MALVRGLAFLMGSEDKNAVSDEKPSHWAEVRTFWMDRFEVTVADYQRCIDAGACSTDVRKATEDERCSYGGASMEQHPMNCVSWENARTYCSWAGKRLPSEAEWERAAGGAQGRPYVWGAGRPSCELTCRKEKDDGCDTGKSCVVGSKPSDLSVFGIADMGGNVGEWLDDWYDSAYYRLAPRLNPTGPDKGDRKVLRGGDFSDQFDPFRLVARDRLEPKLRSGVVGFRCARDL